ncbi:MAG TPA: VOC family protein [Thermoanaerobaculia bacterium]|nr:VOC family protein [Thermoanaerobaculia bacterium]
MPEIDAYPPGTFCWAELATTDAAGAKRFYSDLFGWEPTDNPMGPDMYYTMLRKGGRDVGALYAMDQKSESRPRWLSYVSVANADESAARAAQLGGKVPLEPFDVMDFGRMARIEDPTGAVFALWQPRKHLGATLVNEPGAPTWNELATEDVPAARAFYTGLFGWTARVTQEEPTEYTSFFNGERPAGGLYTPPPGWSETPTWTVYFGVADCDATAAKAENLGGRLFKPPTDIPGIGRFAMLADPQGAGFAIVRLASPAG